MPGVRFKFKPLFTVTKHPWVQVPAGQIGVVIAQVGKPTPIGAKSGRYDAAFGNFTDFRLFVEKGGEKGVQRPVLSPGTLAPIHPVAFLVITKPQVFGVPVSDEYSWPRPRQQVKLSGLRPRRVAAQCDAHCAQANRRRRKGRRHDRSCYLVGRRTVPAGAIASRLGGLQGRQRS